MLFHGLGELLLHLGWEWHGAQGTQRVEGLLHMVVMVYMRMMWVVVVVMVRLRLRLRACLWLRVGTGLWYGAEWVRLERRASCCRLERVGRGTRYARDGRGRRRGGLRQFSYNQVQALVFGLAKLAGWLAQRPTVVYVFVSSAARQSLTYILCAEDCLQRVGIVGDDLPSVYQTHALRPRLGGHGILDLEPKLSDRGRYGEVLQVDAAIDLTRRRQDPQVERHPILSHVISLGKWEGVRWLRWTRSAAAGLYTFTLQ